ncbi:MAG: ribosomal protein S18-alanine N-acetyltransferase [Proteobacteria bacterium]|nr:ribosomal protein S18-alanine N-acetyltransferase [Pseudomonadota bacterium]
MRPGSLADAEAIATLAAEALPGAWSQASFRAHLERSSSRLWCAHRGPEMVGFLLAESAAAQLEIHALAVVPEARRGGWGTQLVRAALRFAWDADLDRVHLEVRADNEAAQELYHDHGFVVAGVRPRYYRDGNDALLLTLDLADPRPSGLRPTIASKKASAKEWLS